MCTTESLFWMAEINIVNQLYFNKFYFKKHLSFPPGQGVTRCPEEIQALVLDDSGTQALEIMGRF